MRNLPVIRLHKPFAGSAVSLLPLQKCRVRAAVGKNSPPNTDASQRRNCRSHYVRVRASTGSRFDRLSMKDK